MDTGKHEGTAAADSVPVEELRVSALTEIDSGSVRDSRAETGLRGSPLAVELPRGALVGEYEIECMLGEGGMGAVYEAVHPVIGKRVAIKVIGNALSKDTRAIARFRREAKVLAGLSSSHIVDVFGFGDLGDGRSYFVMERLAGESLRERLMRGRIPLDEALEILDQIARGLEVAHVAGVVHRDLKPENIFIVVGGKAPLVKLLDFGLVKVAAQADDPVATQAGVMFGTPLYCSPEQIRSASSVDHRADVYALGSIAFELVVGRVPFERSTIVEVLAAHLETAPPAPRTLLPEVPTSLDNVIVAMLAKDPTKRPTLGHFQEVIEKLRRFAFATPVVAPAPQFVRQGVAQALVVEPERPTNRRWGLVVAAMGLVACGAIVVVAASQRSTDAPASQPNQPVHAEVIVTPIDLESSPVVPADEAKSAEPSAKPESPRRAPVVADARVARRGQPEPASVQPPVAVARRKGELLILATASCTSIIVDGAARPYEPQIKLDLSVGNHRVELANKGRTFREVVPVAIEADRTVRINKDCTPAFDPNASVNPFGAKP